VDCNIKDLSRFENDFVSNFDTYKADGAFCAVIHADICVIEIMSEIEILDNGNTIFFRDLSIYPQGQVNFRGKVIKNILSLRRQIRKAAKKLGFKKMMITGDRLHSSTSANPGHHVHIEITFREVTNEITDSKQ